jgi:hypothetical protein
MTSLRHRRLFLWGILVLLVYLVAFEVAIPLVRLKPVWYFQARQQQQNDIRHPEHEHEETLDRAALAFLLYLRNITNNQEAVASDTSNLTAQDVSQSGSATVTTGPRPQERHGTQATSRPRSPKSFLSARKKVTLVKSIPYPYRRIGAGPTDALCKWRTFDTKPAKGQYEKWQASLQEWWPSVPRYPSAPGSDVLTTKKRHNTSKTTDMYFDAIQAAALREGICVPTSKSAWDNLHIFSTADARRCLAYAPPGKNPRRRRLLVAGDSYTRQLFIGAYDIVMGIPSNNEIRDGSERRRITLNVTARLKRTFEESTSQKQQSNLPFPELDFVCFDECYGKNRTTSFSLSCSKCLLGVVSLPKKPPKIKDNGFQKIKDVENVIVVGVGIHVVHSFGRNGVKGRDELEAFVKKTSHLPIVLVTTPSYDNNKVPLEHRNTSLQLSGNSQKPRPMYEGLLEMAARHGVPVIDVFQLTRSCVAKNCSYDGGHRSRYVNRWKAQLLLNLLCEVELSTASS